MAKSSSRAAGRGAGAAVERPHTTHPGHSDAAETESPARGETFYARWARRKRAHHDGVSQPAAVPTAAQCGPVSASTPPQPCADPPMQSDGSQTAGGEGVLPALETLDESSDYRGFLAPEVDERLHRLALRKLFRSASFNTTDGLDDYAEDYRTFEALGDVVTAHLREHWRDSSESRHEPRDEAREPADASSRHSSATPAPDPTTLADTEAEEADEDGSAKPSQGG